MVYYDMYNLLGVLYMSKTTEGQEKLSKFSSVLSQLRKERGISQKKASADLGISQALLSHYEKGIRECGLDFVIKCSKYYGVTTDYLLGVTNNRNGSGNDLLQAFENSDDTGSMKTLATSTRYMLEIATSAIHDRVGMEYIYDYLMLSLYRGALTMEKAGMLPKEMFKIDYSVARELASAAVAIQDARTVFIEDKSRTGTLPDAQLSALQTLISEAEAYILSHFIS